MAEATTASLKSIVEQATVPYIEFELRSVTTAVEVDLTGGKARIEVILGFPAAGIADALGADVGRQLAEQAGIEADVRVSWDVRAHAVQGNLVPLAEVRNIIAVASGKGGVGKSTTAVNLALALQAEGARAGVLDADIYGPSQPQMLGVADQQPVSTDGKTFEPLEAHGLQAMSIGFLVGQEKPVIWRGPMVTQALNQLMFQTNWRDLDYLVVDLPPGTGDIQLTLTSKVPVSGAIVVTTPQDIALLDARRGLKMFEKVDVRILGVVENMSSYVCAECGHEESVFGSGGGETLSRESGMPLLGAMPLDIRIRREADGGEPTVIREPDSEIALRYREIARRAAARLAAAPRDRKGAFGDIVIEGTS
jgi:ATP-binding protein involved in chromosome partitioning